MDYKPPTQTDSHYTGLHTEGCRVKFEPMFLGSTDDTTDTNAGAARSAQTLSELVRMCNTATASPLLLNTMAGFVLPRHTRQPISPASSTPSSGCHSARHLRHGHFPSHPDIQSWPQTRHILSRPHSSSHSRKRPSSVIAASS
jgi:hypothetical protein